ncbi:MAG: hypothetical protein M3Y21_08405 [Candidatus Eremiobacteraeota bacterium]|nr:hypothetical protein [Candidatus Eremiobacteraeota bacterium]
MAPSPNDLVFELLGEHHDRAAFTCSGAEGLILQEYLRSDARALREHGRHVTTVHVPIRKSQPLRICDFMTLSTATVEIEEFPKKLRRALPLYRPMPALRIGRMAVADEGRGSDVGTLLIDEVFRICVQLRDSVGFVALLADAKTDVLIAYYEGRGFSRLPERRRGLFITQAAMAEIIR